MGVIDWKNDHCSASLITLVFFISIRVDVSITQTSGGADLGHLYERGIGDLFSEVSGVRNGHAQHGQRLDWIGVAQHGIQRPLPELTQPQSGSRRVLRRARRLAR